MQLLYNILNKVKPVLYLVFVLILSSSCYADDIIHSDYDVYSTISTLEKQVYNREYNQENFYTRLSRLEKSVYNTVYTDSIYKRLNRLQDSLALSKSTNLADKRQVILDLLEKRYFGFTYKDNSMETRLARLEECIYGKETIGNIDYKFENLAKQIPAANQQNITRGQNTDTYILSKDYKEYTSFLDIDLNNSDSDYYSSIKKLNGIKALKWNHFPILIYIYPDSDKNCNIARKAVQIWSEYIQIKIVNNAADADILINWKKNYTNIVRFDQAADYENTLYSRDEKLKMSIYCGRYKDTPYLDRFLAHQIGHTLGLWGHSKDKNDIMYPFKEFKNDINYRNINNEDQDTSVTSSPYRPSAKDINTLIRIYR